MSEASLTGHGLTIRRATDSSGVVLALSGELDLATAPQLDRRLRDLGEPRPGRLLLDLRGLEFMDSVGLASIIRAQRSADAHGHRLSLRRGASQVERLIELSGVGDHLAFED